MTRDKVNVRWKDGGSFPVEIDETGTHWKCLCGCDLNIDRDVFQVTGGRRLDCPACGRQYFEQPQGDVYELPQ